MIWRFTLISKIDTGPSEFYTGSGNAQFTHTASPNQVIIGGQDSSHNIMPGMQIDIDGNVYDITAVSYSNYFQNLYLILAQPVDDEILGIVDFTITNPHTYEGEETEVDEPLAWDALSMVLQRDKDWHGIAPQFSTSNLKFVDDAYWILKEEEARAGVDGDVGIRIEWSCDDCDCYKPFFEGKIDFKTFKEDCGEYCYISAGLQEESPITQLDNRGDTDVDLTSNTANDGATVLTDYAGLNKELQIPSKAVLQQTKALNSDTLVSENFAESTEWFANTVSTPPQMRAQIMPGFNKIIYTDIADSAVFSDPLFVNGGFQNMPAENMVPVIDMQRITDNLECTNGDVHIKYRFKGNLDVQGGGLLGANLYLYKLGAGKDETDLTNYEQLASDNFSFSGFDIQKDLMIQLAPGDKLWYYFFILATQPEDYTTFILTEDPECYFEASVTSLCEPTPCTTYLLHEAASRVVESVTNNQLKFKSEYFGRTDSEPFAFNADGCGGLRTITNGLQLRRAVLPDNTTPKVFTSWNKITDSLNATDHIGIGIEQLPNTDPVFPNAKVVRCEPVTYFYRPDVVFIADGVDAFSRQPKNDRIWNQFTFGFEKYETESTNGLDAIHTERQYRVPIQNSDQEIKQLCKYILDGYAIEVTRRKFGTTEDWRYDQDIFMFCLARTTELIVEQGNIDFAENLFDPSTVINYRLSPIRNAMRWFNWVMQGIKQIDPALTKMLFNSGKGNYVARGKLQGADCFSEVNTIAENDPLFVNQFYDADAGKPFILPEEVTFDYPLGLEEFLFLKDNIYGVVQYRRFEDEPWKFGWIDRLEPRHEDGKASFTLVTALGIKPVEVENFILGEDGLVIMTETGLGLTQG